MSALPAGIRRQHREALAAARRLRSQLFDLFCAAYRCDLNVEAANALHQESVRLERDLERLPRLPARDPRSLAGGGA